MSAKIINYVEWPAENGIIAQLCCDTVDELPAVNDFSQFGTLAPTSTCRVINTDELYQLNTVGVWKIKQQATSVALDLSDYLTMDQSDARYQRIGTGTTISNTDVDTLTSGRYRNSSTTHGCTNLPSDLLNRPFTIDVSEMPAAGRYRQIAYGAQSSTIGMFWMRAQYSSGGNIIYSPWYKYTGVAET